MQEWKNWSGSLRFAVAQVVEPRNEEELRNVIRDHHRSGKKLRLAAAGHSSSPLVQTNETLIHLRHFKGIVDLQPDRQTVTIRSGMTVNEANKALQQLDLALFNTGDVDVQTLAGAISTGTHGSGRKLQNLAGMLCGARMITPDGEVVSFSEQQHPEIMKAMRVSLGAMGIFSEITVKVLPLFKLHRKELFTDIETCLHNFDQVADENRNVDFYWYPRSDEAKIRVLNEPGSTKTFRFPHRCDEEEEGWVGEILPRKRVLKFDEMEYALPKENGIACFRAVRKRVLDRHRKDVAWRVLYRTIASDMNYLSPHYGRESVSISLHHNAGLPFDEYFNDIEPIFIDHGGRPHWAKKHNRKAAQLRGLYPEWDTFMEIRRSLDPEGFFMNDYLHTLLTDERQ